MLHYRAPDAPDSFRCPGWLNLLNRFRLLVCLAAAFHFETDRIGRLAMAETHADVQARIKRNLVDAQGSGLSLLWAHDLAPLTTWLAQTKSQFY